MQEDFVRKTPYHQGFLGKQHLLSGQLAIQPIISVDNKPEILLDELLGNQFALISAEKLRGVLVETFHKKLGGKVLLLDNDFQSTIFKEWMVAQQMDFVLIRPDRYIFDAGKMDDLENVLNALFNQLN